MISYVMLRDVNPVVLDELARSWEQFGRQCVGFEQRWERQVLGQLRRSDWTGPAADAALRTLERHDDVFEITAMQATGIVTVLTRAASGLRDLQHRLRAVLDEAQSHGYTVTGTGPPRLSS